MKAHYDILLVGAGLFNASPGPSVHSSTEMTIGRT